MSADIKRAYTYRDLERDIWYLIPSCPREYPRYYVERQHRIDAAHEESYFNRMLGRLPPVAKEPDLLCPYCFMNKNYQCCAQCDGKGFIEGFKMNLNGEFIGIIKSGEQIQ